MLYFASKTTFLIVKFGMVDPVFTNILNQFQKTNHIWLVVWTPLKNISQLGWLFPIYGKIKHVPNHQPDIIYQPHIFSFLFIPGMTFSIFKNHQAAQVEELALQLPQLLQELLPEVVMTWTKGSWYIYS